MNSHILIPKCVLKKFVNDKQYYFKYDIITDKITKAYPKTTNTAPDYFSPKMEKDLSEKIERPLTQLYKYYENFDFDCTESYLDEDTKIIALNYARSLITRNPSFFDFTKNNAIYIQFMSEQNQHDLVVDYSMDSRICGDLFQNIDVSFIINKTQTPFILISNGYYPFILNCEKYVHIPLSTHFGIILKQKDLSDKIPLFILNEGYDKIIDNLNKVAFSTQKKEQTGFIISNRRECVEHFIYK